MSTPCAAAPCARCGTAVRGHEYHPCRPPARWRPWGRHASTADQRRAAGAAMVLLGIAAGLLAGLRP